MRRYVFSFTLLALFSCDAASEFLYRWKDESGHVHYSDQVPPEQSKYRRERLNRHGRTVEVLEGAKTPAEIEQEEQLRKLRAEQRRLLAEQRAHDSALLRTFSSEEDMIALLQSKLNAIDGLIKVTEANQARLKAQLKMQKKRAAMLDRNGKKIPKTLIDGVYATQRQIAENRKKIDAHRQEKKRLRNKFEQDIRRFRVLTDANTTDNGAGPKHRKTNAGSDQANEKSIGLVHCANAAHCDKAWALAKSYVARYATTELQIDTDHILMTADPRDETDISLTVSKIPAEASGGRLFLNVRCKESALGQELCTSAKVHNIRAAFRPFIRAGLDSPS
jgi:Domain of unknown function (DUF4124)